MSLRCGISKSLDPVLIPNSFNFGVAARTTEPCLFVSATTASLVVYGSNPFSIHDTLAKKLFWSMQSTSLSSNKL